MRQLLPHPAEVDPLEALDVVRPVPVHRPWVLGLMAATADGAATVEGLSGAIGGPGDLQVFRAVRALADVVLVGAGTVRDEGYGPVRSRPEAAPRRAERHQGAHPRLAIVTARLSLSPDLRLFTEADERDAPPLVLHPPGMPDAARRELAGHAELVEVAAAADGGVDPAAALAALHERGARTVVCEGGPRLNATLVDADLLDELSLTLDPRVVGGEASRILDGTGPGTVRPWRTEGLLEHEGTLFWRITRARGD